MKVFSNQEKETAGKCYSKNRKYAGFRCGCETCHRKSALVLFSVQSLVLGIGDRLQPLIGTVFARNFHRKVRKPALRRCTVPMFHTGGDIDHIAGNQTLRRFAPFLVVPFTGHADENLPATVACLMNMLT